MHKSLNKNSALSIVHTNGINFNRFLAFLRSKWSKSADAFDSCIPYTIDGKSSHYILGLTVSASKYHRNDLARLRFAGKNHSISFGILSSCTCHLSPRAHKVSRPSTMHLREYTWNSHDERIALLNQDRRPSS